MFASHSPHHGPLIFVSITHVRVYTMLPTVFFVNRKFFNRKFVRKRVHVIRRSSGLTGGFLPGDKKCHFMASQLIADSGGMIAMLVTG